MENYEARIIKCMDYLRSVRFPCNDWKEDKVYFDKLEAEFSEVPADEETKILLDELKKLIQEKRNYSLDYNKTTEELFAGWDED